MLFMADPDGVRRVGAEAGSSFSAGGLVDDDGPPRAGGRTADLLQSPRCPCRAPWGRWPGPLPRRKRKFANFFLLAPSVRFGNLLIGRPDRRRGAGNGAGNQFSGSLMARVGLPPPGGTRAGGGGGGRRAGRGWLPGWRGVTAGMWGAGRPPRTRKRAWALRSGMEWGGRAWLRLALTLALGAALVSMTFGGEEEEGAPEPEAARPPGVPDSGAGGAGGPRGRERLPPPQTLTRRSAQLPRSRRASRGLGS